MAGTFKLELAWHSASQFLGRNLSWVTMLAEEKNIRIVLEDSTAPSGQTDSGEIT